MWGPEFVAQARDIAKEGAKLASLTFSLFHVKACWTKVKGHKNQSAEASNLGTIHGSSSLKDSWTCLPEAVEDDITGFGVATPAN